jgi:DNA-binding NarL/FixJ family response regulator
MSGMGLEQQAVKVFVVDSHAIYRRGLVASLTLLEGISTVGQAQTAGEAARQDALHDADVVIVDTSAADIRELISDITQQGSAHVIACAADSDEKSVAAAMEAGAASYLRKDLLTQELLSATMQAVRGGAAVIAPHDAALRGAPGPVDPAGRGNTPLTDRERRVLGLIADGHPTREVALELCYSERTVKNILHDVVTKLNARSRSQAVAHAVRDGLI